MYAPNEDDEFKHLFSKDISRAMFTSVSSVSLKSDRINLSNKHLLSSAFLKIHFCCRNYF